MLCVRVTTEQQLTAEKQIRKAVFVDEQGVDESLEWDEYDVSPEACHHFLITDDGEPVATGRWREYKPGIAKFQRIAVLSPYRGRSVGRLLMETMETDARESGCSGVILDAQCTAEPFYRKLGYEAVSPETFLDAGILHVRMGKNWS
ncbi:GNAT family N-acetyltransferase [Cohnella lubricantis]|uniref:GNAT family N-acetyltransferase n=1 Tax=Cohnella lubricantis TaxID=2163172 RepID=A0A841TGX1_9BACL|nr:GNAT family N-acetyltransferase [Cohnella lubricantis]MBB6679636.1 GNAT family N-acetyltransferase [Cohnella lubricantis]MBP2118590.1 putative GNAT family N-acyltransferase [Cohnella lubricantis]